MRLETEAALEWGGVCARLADFAATTAGRAACEEGRVPVGQSREESEALIEQTAAALLPAPLDFGGVEDVSAAVVAAAGGRLLAVREICGVARSIRAARGVFEQMEKLTAEMPDTSLLVWQKNQMRKQLKLQKSDEESDESMVVSPEAPAVEQNLAADGHKKYLLNLFSTRIASVQ